MKSHQINEAMEKLWSDFTEVCPHCGTKAHLVLVHNDHHRATNLDQYNYITFRCKPCGKLSVHVYLSCQNPYSSEENLTPEKWVAVFPATDTIPDQKFVTHVPTEVLQDYAEGLVCLSVGAARAAVGMFRRAIQNAMIHLGADQKLELIDQIRSIDRLTNDIKDWAHNIRIFGNWGAHPQSDLLKDVTPDLATETRELVEEFMNYVYVMPGKVTAARKRYEKSDDDEQPDEKVEK